MLDDKFALLRRPSLRASLGRVAHRVIERAHGDDLEGVASDDRTRPLRATWEEELRREYQDLLSAWAPSTPPPPRDWPGHALTRARTLRALEEAPRPADELGPPAFVRRESELVLKDPQTGLRGRLDALTSKDGRLRVIEYKSGVHQREPRTDQRLQLLLYAYLVHQDRDVWPDEIALRDSRGVQHVEPLDPSESLEAVSDALSRLRALIEAAEEGPDSLAALAQPSAEACRWCTFRPTCRPFWNALCMDWSLRGAVLGRVERCNLQRIELRALLPSELRRRTVRVLEPGRDDLRTGDLIAVVDGDSTSSETDLRVRWDTQVVRLGDLDVDGSQDFS